MNIQSLAEILREAAAIIQAIPISAQPGNMRQPIVDELEGFASWVEKCCVFRAEYDELLSQLEAVGAGGVNGRLMPGAAPVSAEPVAEVVVEQRRDSSRLFVTNVRMLRGVPHGTKLYAAPVSAEPMAVPDGWKLVPVEPTAGMLQALSGEWHSSRQQEARARYADMLTAAPVAAQPDITQQTLDDVKAGIPARDAEIASLNSMLQFLIDEECYLANTSLCGDDHWRIHWPHLDEYQSEYHPTARAAIRAAIDAARKEAKG